MDDRSFTKAAPRTVPSQPPEVRIGDFERQAAARQLHHHGRHHHGNVWS